MFFPSQDSFIANLLRIIQHMRPKVATKDSKQVGSTQDRLAQKFPGLALPNEGQYKALIDGDSSTGKKKAKNKESSDKDDVDEKDDVIDDAMAALEALAPSHIS